MQRQTYGYLASRRTSLPHDCLTKEAHACEQLAHGRYVTAARPGVELATSGVAIQRPNHYTTRPHSAGRQQISLFVTYSSLVSFRVKLPCSTHVKDPMLSGLGSDSVAVCRVSLGLPGGRFRSGLYC